MEEERPLQGAGDEGVTRESKMSSAGQQGRSRISGPIIVGVVLVISLLIAGLFLPPISLGQRLSGTTAEGETAASEITSDADPAAGQVTLHLPGGESADITAVAPDELQDNERVAAMVAGMPETASLASSLYLIDYGAETAPRGNITVAVPGDAGELATLDLYGWSGSSWVMIPLDEANESAFVSSEVSVPHAVALMQTSAPQDPVVAAEVLPSQSLPAAVLPHITEVSVGTLTLGDNGELLGEVAEVPDGGYRQVVRATNTGIVVDQASLATLLGDEGLISQHIDQLVNAAADYSGVNLDYQGIDLTQRAAFTSLVDNLAAKLHEQGKSLIVTLETPVYTDGEGWNTGGQEWQAIGRAADVVYLQLPLDPAAYEEGGLADELLAWSVRQIPRDKVNLLATVDAVDMVGGTYREVPTTLALANFGELSLTEGGEAVEAGTPVEVSLGGTASPLEWDGDTLMYRYTYEQAGQEHTVWISNEAVTGHRLRFADHYHMRGVALRGLGSVDEGAGFAKAIESYLSAAAVPEPAGAAIVWTVADAADSIVASSSGEALTYRWEDTDEPGDYTINAVFAQGDAVADLGSVAIAVDPVATPEPTPTQAVAEVEATPEEDAAPTATPVPPINELDPGSADAIVNIASNFRKGPGLGYGVIEVLAAGTKLSLTGRNAAGDWFQVQVVDNPEKEGWLYSNLLSVNSGVNVSGLEVVEVDPPLVGGGPPPPPPPPVVGGNFALGGQTHTLANPTLMSQAGMTWVKFQHKWGPGDTPDAVAGRIGQAHANGFKVLLSIPGSAAYPSSIDFNAYAQFLGGVAALGPDAIEVWNEMNIDFEWPAGQINPTTYVNNMLAPAYQAIKAANANVMVISGAPAPTGYDNGTNAWADDRYMAGVAAAGGANYMDCIGVHHNAGATSPSAASGHPAGNNHYSWYFLPTLNMYYNTFGGARPVCFTELGYLSGQDFGGVPSRFSWAAGTTVAQHAQWLGEAASLAGNSGKVRLMIVFNVDFTTWGEDPQAGYAILRPDGSCPACSTLSAAMGR